MSNLVFPSVLQGMDIKVDREPLDAVHADEAESGKETRWTGSTYPRYRYRLDFNILRADSALANLARNREWQQFCTHVARHFVRLSDFLWTDPDDSSVTDMGFAVGDGTTASFQLQRSMGGDYINQLGEFAPATKPTTNLVRQSQALATSPWAGAIAGTGVTPLVRNNEGIAPDGTPTATYVRCDRGASNTSADQSRVWNGVTMTLGFTYVFSVWLRTTDGSTQQVTLETASGIITVVTVTGTWQRFSTTAWTSTGTTSTSTFIGTRGNVGASQAVELFAWGAQVETASVAGGYIPTTTVAVTLTPSYWPAFGDGFEPVFDLNGAPTIYEDGTWRGRRSLSLSARTNLLPFSEQFDNAAWVKTNATITANSTTAPDGTANADTFNEGAAVTVVHNAAQNTTIAEAQGELRCYSIFVKASSLPNIRWKVATSGEGISFNLGTGVIDAVIGGALASGVISDPRWPGWFRIWFTKRVSATLGTGAVLAGCLDGTYAETYTGTSRTFFSWGAMAERVSNLNGPTAYIPTPSGTAVTVTDGTLSATAAFTPAAVPVAGTFYSWDGSFYRRVRIDMASVPTTRLVQFMYEAKRIQLISTKP